MDVEVCFKTAVLSAFIFCSLRAVLANAPGSSNENICKEGNGTCEWLASSSDYNGNLAGAGATDMRSVSVEITTAETSGKDPEPVASAKTEVLVVEAMAAEVEQMAGEPVVATVPSDKPAAPKMVASKPTSGDSNEMGQAAMEEPIASVADLALEELRSLLQQARMAVSRLEDEVIRQERRLARLAAATTASVASLAGSSAAALEPAVEAAGTAVLRSLGIDGSSVSTAARQALREVLEQILWGRTMRGGHAEKGSGASGGRSLTRTAPAFAGVAQEDWFGRHFAVRAAAWLLPPPPSPPEVAEADAAMLAEPAIATPATITCAFPYELPHPNAAASGGGALQYIVAGDATGVLYILSPADGSVMAVLSSGTDSAVTACSAFYVRRYESTVVTGHANGQTRSFTVILQEGEENEAGESTMTDTKSKQRRRQSNSRTMKLVVQSVRLRHVVESMPPGALPWTAVQEMPSEATGKAQAKMMMEPAAEAGGEQAADAMGETTESQYTGPPAPIMHILPYSSYQGWIQPRLDLRCAFAPEVVTPQRRGTWTPRTRRCC
ncbi:hypothetical protein Vretimale_15277 [Volvox reticuliferus]|uniref:Uncharacterized protein n=1 Tax=Volvox reticuliferus TaxID=1737510 RepID=A0A8J4C5B9_9CHLO|nr:hypothetical protein Vretifemale_5474 [Volvox reticuliferus]GIM11818.1 hypothetical protein Vretimale_15277 [Volvox reticuliferus]